jgi:bile acid-coenzyme A ligase
VTVVPMIEMLRRTAAARPNSPAVTVDGTTLSYAQLDERSDQIAVALSDEGVRAGSFVTIALPNSIQFVEAALATMKLGAVIQPVSSRLTLRERNEIVELADSVVVVGAQPGEHGARRCLPNIDDLDLKPLGAPLPIVVSQPWRATTSGGSTGRPKLIVGVPPAVVDDASPDALLPTDGVVLIPGPLYHGGPFLIGITSLFHGNHLVLQSRFDAEEALRLIQDHRVGYVLLVPTMMSRIWRLDPVGRSVDMSSIETVLHLAAVCPAWLKERWIEWLGPERIYELYAASDGPNRTIISGTEWLAHKGSVGRAQPDELRIADADGRQVPAGTTGEIWMRPPRGQQNRVRVVGTEPREVDGWTSVGDLGWLDEEGYLYIADRRTDLIITGGHNVYAAEVEAALDAHEGVRSSAVLGLPDEDMGWRVHAVVEVEDWVTEADLREHLTKFLVPYKWPRSYELVSEQLRDDAGKVRKSTLASRTLKAEKLGH